MSDHSTERRDATLVRVLLPAAAAAAFAMRWLPLDYPPAGEVRSAFSTAFFDHAASVAQAAIIVLNAAGMGAFILRRLRLPGGAVQAAGLGLGATSLLVLALGSAGLMDFAFAGLLVLPGLVFARDIARTLSGIARRAREFLSSRSVLPALLVIAVGLVLLLNVVRCFIPPLDYDVLEYHLGAPAQYWRDGGIGFLPRNVYAAMPSNSEMLYLFALGLKGDLIRGAALAHLVNVAAGLLAAVAAGSLARRISGSSVAALLAATGFYLLPWTSLLSTRAYAEPGMILFGLLAIDAAFAYFGEGEAAGARRGLLLAGVFAGLSAGCKYPAALFLIVPLTAAIAAAWAARGQWRRAIAGAAIFCAAAAVPLAPWLARNAAATGNPTYPLLYGLFGGRNWSPEQDAKWAKAHRPAEFGAASFAGAAWRFLREPEAKRLEVRPDGSAREARSGSALMWLPVLLGLACLPRKGRHWLLAAYPLAVLVLWYLFTHRIARFVAPWFMVLVVPAAWGAARAAARRPAPAWALIAAAMLLLAGYSLREREPRTEAFCALGFFNEHELLDKITEHANFSYRGVESINRLPRGCRVLMVGEAQTFYCEREVVAATVFDRNPLERLCNDSASPADVRSALASMGVTHIYLNAPEFKRLRTTYAYSFEGRERPGCWDLTERGWRNFSELLAGQCDVAWQAGGPPWKPSAPAGGWDDSFSSHVLFRLKGPS